MQETTKIAISAVSAVACFALSISLSKRADRIRTARHEKWIAESNEAHKQNIENLEGIIDHLDKKIEAGKFWLQVTGE